ncbi:MAG: tetratricopeptide repeat protein [Promethearchaeota archaeon]
MYAHFEPPERVFVGREDYIEWMNKALQRCKDKSVVMHLRGIGGIGKSSLLDYWTRTIDTTIRLDCDQYIDFYSRLNMIAKGAMRLGIELKRFDILWKIRQRFVEGVEPAKEKDRTAEREILSLIPFVGTLAGIGAALTAIGAKVTPKLRGKFGDVGSWLKSRLGESYIEKLLEVLWKEPRHAEFLYLDALLEDLNTRKDSKTPVVVMLDQSETVDKEREKWRYKGRDITEIELWLVFLSSLSNCVGVMASRQAAPRQINKELDIEEFELTELERDSCIELLGKRGVTDKALQERVISVSGGNPFVINTMCDLLESEPQTLDDIEDLRSETLEAVRLKVWRRLFSQAEGLQELLDRASLVPYFNREILGIIAPTLTVDKWDRLTQLSFIKVREDGTLVLHDLAKDLTISELGHRLPNLVDEAVALLEKESTEKSDYSLQGLAVSVLAVKSEEDALTQIKNVPWNLVLSGMILEIDSFLNSLSLSTQLGETVVQHMKGWFLSNSMGRIADGEQLLQDSLRTMTELAGDNPQLLGYVGDILNSLGYFYGTTTHRLLEGERAYRDAIDTYLNLDKNVLTRHFGDLVSCHAELGWVLAENHRYLESLEVAQKGLILLNEEKSERIAIGPREMIANALCTLTIGRAHYRMGELREAESILAALLEQTKEIIALRRLVVNMLGDVYRFMGKSVEAERMFWEIEPIQRDLFEAGSLIDLGWYIKIENGLVQLLEMNGKQSDADAIIPKALSHAREMILTAPDYWDILLSWSIHNNARHLQRKGKVREAEDAYQELLDIWQKHAIFTPDFGNPMVAHTLNNLGIIFRQTGRIAEAEAVYREALDSLKDVKNRNPEGAFLADLYATILNNLGVLLATSIQESKAEDAFNEALEIRDSLCAKCPEVVGAGLEKTLRNLVTFYSNNDKEEESEEFKDRLRDLEAAIEGDIEFTEEELIHPWFR